MTKLLDIRDVDDFNKIEINIQETFDKKVFNPYKTNIENMSNDKN